MSTLSTLRRRARLRQQPPALALHIGNTPLLPLRVVTRHLPPGTKVLAKAEHLNPGGSVKDRPAREMIRRALRTGALRTGMTLLDATSGNTGIAFAMIGAAMGLPVRLVMPANASMERRQILGSYGATLDLTDPTEGTDGAQRRARELYERDPERYLYLDQYNNPANWQAHFHGTGPEILAQTERHLTHFVAGLGTSGSFTGVTRRLKQALPSVRCLAVQPASPLHGIEGMKHMATAIVPGIFDPSLVDAYVSVETEEAQEMTRRLAREEGLLVGVSSGANVAAALRVAERAAGATVVTLLPDTGTRYLSDPFWHTHP